MQVDEYMALSKEARERQIAGLAPRELLQLGIDLFNAGRYFEAHEAWEEVWLEAPRALRAFYQGLIQVAAGFVHLTRNEYAGTERLLEEGVAKLEKYAPDFLGVAVERLAADGTAARQRVLTVGQRGLRDIDRRSLPRIEQQAQGASLFWEEGGVRLHWLEWAAAFEPSRPTGRPTFGLSPRGTAGEDETATVRLAGARNGRETIVLVHALGLVARTWQPVAARLADAGYRVVAPDLPGHGESGEQGGAVEDEIEWLRRWLSAAGGSLRAATAAGMSAGIVARIVGETGALEVCLDPREATGPGDGDVRRERRRTWPSRAEMFETLSRRPLFSLWRPDLLWTYVEDGTRVVEGGVELRCQDEVEWRFLALGRPLKGSLDIDVSPLSKPVAAAEHLLEALAGS